MGKVKVGVISDTHGLLRPAAKDALTECQMILHAGDIGKLEILNELNKIAPVTAVRGNVDQEDWAKEIPPSQVIEIEGVSIYMLHDLGAIDLDPASAGFGVVISGHTHQASILEQDGILFFNPGSAGPRRFHLPVSLAILEIENQKVSPNLILLDSSE